MTMEEAIQQLDGAEMMLLNREFIQFNQAIIMAISALRIQQKQESECTKCSGIMYRQTDSGKIIPVGVSMYAGWYDRPVQTLNNAAIEAWNRRAREEKQIDVVFCRECKLQGNCFAEDHFSFAGIKDPFCCVGKRKEGADNEH